MLQSLFSSGLGKALVLLIISATPIIELRGAIPVGASQGLPFWETFALCVIGNMIPIPFIILFARKIISWLKNTKHFSRPISWLEQHVLKKSSSLYKYKYHLVGLALFVAIPLPGTGAWTGAILAALLDIRIQWALPTIFFGVVVAAFIVSGMSYGFIHAISLFAPGL